MTLLRGLVSLDQRISAGSLLILPPKSSERQSSQTSSPRTDPQALKPAQLCTYHLSESTWTAGPTTGFHRVASQTGQTSNVVERSSAVSTLRPDRPVLRSAVSAPSCPRQNYPTRNCSTLLTQLASQAAHHIIVQPDQLNPNRLTGFRTKKNLGAKAIDNRHIFS